MQEILSQLVGIEEQCATAFNKKNLSEILDYFHEDISGFSSTEHDRFQGKDELKKTFEYYLTEAESVTYDILDPRVSQFNDIAILSFYWRVTLRSGSKRLEIPGRGTHVFHKVNDQWKIVHEHFSRAH
jgi:ketosteroid isomerase-like protein